MAIQTQLVGKFGGGVPETAETRVTGDGMYSPPKGWKKAMGAFYGQCTSTENPTIFGQNIVRPYNGFVSGGGVTLYAKCQRVSGTITWVRLE